MNFLLPNPAMHSTGYDDGYFGPAAVAVALHELAARKTGVERFVVAEHHTRGGRVYEAFTVVYGTIDGEPRFRFWSGAAESSLAGGPTDPVEISRAVADLTAHMTRPGACIYRVAS